MTDSNSLWVDQQRRVEAFRDAFSYLPLHNYLNGAYHAANMYWCAPPYGLMWRIPAFFVPNSVLLLVDVEPVVDDIREKLRATRELIEEMKPSLDHEVERLVHSAGRPYDNLPADMVVEDQSTAEGYGSAWSYTFNPYRLAIAMLDEYEHFITAAMKSRKTPFTQASRICQKAKALGGRVNLVTGAMK